MNAAWTAVLDEQKKLRASRPVRAGHRVFLARKFNLATYDAPVWVPHMAMADVLEVHADDVLLVRQPDSGGHTTTVTLGTRGWGQTPEEALASYFLRRANDP